MLFVALVGGCPGAGRTFRLHVLNLTGSNITLVSLDRSESKALDNVLSNPIPPGTERIITLSEEEFGSDSGRVVLEEGQSIQIDNVALGPDDGGVAAFTVNLQLFTDTFAVEAQT